MLKPYLLILKPQCFDYDELNKIVFSGGYHKKFNTRDEAARGLQALIDDGVVTFDYKSQTAIPLYSAYICKHQAFFYPLERRNPYLLKEDMYFLVERMDFAPKTLGWYNTKVDVERDWPFGTNGPRIQRMVRDQKAYEGWYKKQW